MKIANQAKLSPQKFSTRKKCQGKQCRKYAQILFKHKELPGEILKHHLIYNLDT